MDQFTINPFSGHNWNIGQNRQVFTARLSIILLITLIIAINSMTGFAVPNNVECIKDKVLDATDSINQYYNDNSTVFSVTVICTSLIIDVMFLNISAKFVLFGKTWRPIIFFLLFYMSRFFIQSFFILTKPEDMVWKYPGFPSLTVPYFESSDFYYSGHAGNMLFVTLECATRKDYKFMFLGLFGIFVIPFMLIATRTHYFIDVVVGLLVAHYFWFISKTLSKMIDKRFNYQDEAEVLSEKKEE